MTVLLKWRRRKSVNKSIKYVKFKKSFKKKKLFINTSNNSNLDRRGDWLEQTFGLKNAKSEDMLSDAVMEMTVTD